MWLVKKWSSMLNTNKKNELLIYNVARLIPIGLNLLGYNGVLIYYITTRLKADSSVRDKVNFDKS